MGVSTTIKKRGPAFATATPDRNGGEADGPACAHPSEHDGGRTLCGNAKRRAVSGSPTDQTLFTRAKAERTDWSPRKGESCLRWEPAPD
ncbi:hypothetical protein K0C01_02350 [Salinarchaeum sp. IM2453]|uniref:hypothetical protein n=1 Tax=Salinarchaeum sp. IM2453 TaxID=2862870 RepID=UPI001C83CA70|nr:hypothetical protein [Salinarchaeum sp. IM2453]QZA89025.1 hypothetical protein K0C01_02350 [Salinarchaeum sp. IM2453]